ncbi:phytanoyl-CoA dioxygenase family protein [Mycobacterium spongiae]|uniref:Phytanoyl-CoA dioxygenase family protein n=1 Tax=Mycobacterium spongiae TaxID=886343 RepID=A0A975PXI7_9MYCO|nr:phytanoyl-CoA dioxygenase family protein [Mycobacterium spongiae]QUR68142.1 phytanoyl-CoA dioxygenase family protein [Mycobacterium spongiae]
MKSDVDLVTKLADLKTDLAQRYPVVPSGGATVDPETVAADLAAIERDGYVIWENLISDEECRKIRDAVIPLLGHTGRNGFEGHSTQRVYSVLNKTRVCDRLVDHPRVLAMLDHLFLPNYLLSQLQVININPGESSQLLHHDDGLYPVPRPRPPLGAATIWAIDAFTEDNGATVVVPGSHRWEEPKRKPGPNDRVESVVMPAGSCVFFVGTLWHGGGANHSACDRLAVTAQYCEAWLRPQEAFTLSVPRDVARAASPDIQRMLGYNVHPPFVGAVDGLHPLRLLEDDSVSD